MPYLSSLLRRKGRSSCVARRRARIRCANRRRLGTYVVASDLHPHPAMSCVQSVPELDANNLLLGADWALAHGDLGTVAYLTGLLARRAHGSLHVDLLELASLFDRDPERASHKWPLLRARAIDELATTRHAGT